MAEKVGMSRRRLIEVAAAGAGAALVAGCKGELASTEQKSPVAGKGVGAYTNSDFYDESGKFLVDKAKQAYFDMMDRFGYPIPPSLRDGMWAVDFSLSDFVHVGMAGIMWWNSKQYSYFGHEIFLLPGQMIAEHAHVKTADAAAKMEAWHVRHGMIYTFGEGEPTQPLPVKVPDSQKDKYITAWNCQPLMPGEVRELNRLEAKHFMLAGPAGAIVTEYATYHDGAALRFTNPGVKF